MIELLLYSNLTCVQANNIIERAEKFNFRHGFSPSDLQELVAVVKESTPECFNEGSESNP